jgi:hypothetical protein
MDRARSKVVAQTHTLSKALLFSLIRCTWTLHHTRIAILGFMTHYLVQTPLQSESYVYISRLVKTRDPYPGLFQLAVVFLYLSSLPSLFRLFLWCLPFIHLFFQLYACLYLVDTHSHQKKCHMTRFPTVCSSPPYLTKPISRLFSMNNRNKFGKHV